MTIKQQGGIFGRNPTFNDVTVDGTLSTGGTISTTSNMVIEAGSPNIRFAETDTTDENYRIRVQAGQFIFEKLADNNSIVTECFRVDSSNNLNLKTGSLAVANGQGIDFSATSGTGTSELFSDYEEGSWTPDVQDASGNSASTSSASGTYTKVGDLVTAFIRVIDVDKSGLTAGDGIRVYGLPYTAAGSTRYGGSAIINTWTGTTGLITQVIGGNTYAQFKTPDNGNALVSEITSGSADIYAQVTYKV